jgi:hypothetical protein
MHQVGPLDDFKKDRVKKPSEKPCAEKVTLTNHWSEQQLLQQVSPLKGHRKQVTWSEFMKDFGGYERLIDRIVNQAMIKEAASFKRELAKESQQKRGVLVQDPMI